MTKPTSAEREFCEEFGIFSQTSGDSRVPGLILGWLLICQPEHQSITQIATALDISKASVSTVIRQLQFRQNVERYAVSGTRQHYYRLSGGGSWLRVMRARLMYIAAGRRIGQQGIELMEREGKSAGRLREFTAFLTFLEEEFDNGMMERWEKYRVQHLG